MDHNRNNLLTHFLLNFFPIIGYWFWDWDLFTMIYLFWMEGVIQIFFNAMKIMNAKQFDPKFPTILSKLFISFRVSILKFLIFLFYLIFIVTFIGFLGTGLNSSSLQVLSFKDKSFNFLILGFIAHQILDYTFNFIANGLSKIKKPSDYTLILNGRYLILHITIVLGIFGFQFLEKFVHVNSKIPGLAYLVILFTLKSIGDFISHQISHSELEELKKVP